MFSEHDPQARRYMALAESHAALEAENTRLRAEVEQLRAIIAFIDGVMPVADETCDEPGITVSEAARRELRDEKHPLFTGDQP